MNTVNNWTYLKPGIGFTNIVARTIQSAGEISREELMDGSRLLRAKLIKFKPKVEHFNIKSDFEQNKFFNEINCYHFGPSQLKL